VIVHNSPEELTEKQANSCLNMSEHECNWIRSMIPQGAVLRPKWLVNTRQISSRRVYGVDTAILGNPVKEPTDPLTKLVNVEHFTAREKVSIHRSDRSSFCI
jgi:hypothetical protein